MSEPRVDCLCAGILVADHLSAPIDHCPAAGELILAEALPLAIGGCAANVGINLAKLEVSTAVAGCVGEDAFGQFLADELAARGVSSATLHRTAQAPTSGTLIVNVAGEDRRFIHCIGANGRFTAADLAAAASAANPRCVYLGGFLLMPAVDPAALATVLADLRAAGAILALDVVLPGPGDHLPSLAAVAPWVDVFFPNNDEAAALTGETDPLRQAEALQAAGFSTVVITCGEQGVVYVDAEQRLSMRPFPIEYVGGAGSGDAFVAGYLAAQLTGLGPRDRLVWGAAAGASCVRSITTTDGVFSRVELETFLAAHPEPRPQAVG